MYQLNYRVTTQSPIVISSQAGDINMVSTEKFIPGSAVLGMLANEFIKSQEGLSYRNAHEDDDFFDWFLAGNLKISNAYIFSMDNESIHYPTPLSIHKEKKRKMKIYDLLLTEDEDLLDKNGERIQTEPIGKFCTFKDNKIFLQDVKTMLNFHHARDREKGIPKEGVIFNYESISENQIFAGKIIGDKLALEKLKEIWNDDWQAFVGRSKNTQYGRVRFEFNEMKEVNIDTLTDNKKTVLTLLSNTIIYNKDGFATVAKEILQDYLAGAIIEKAFVKKTVAENFVSVWRLKKPSEVCFAVGSTFLLNIENCNTAELLKLQITGIGERTQEGFGQCCFGWQKEDVLSLGKLEKSEIKKPGSDHVPECTTEVLKTIISKTIIEQTEKKAIEALDKFKTKTFPTNTLIEKLRFMVKKYGTKDEFVMAIKDFRKNATDKLERCHNNSMNLIKFIETNDISYGNLMKDHHKANGLNKIYDIIDHYPQDDKELEKKLFPVYYSAFFTMMKKRAKITEVHDG